MRTKTPFNLILLILVIVFFGCSKPKEWTIASPDQKISISFGAKSFAQV